MADVNARLLGLGKMMAAESDDNAPAGTLSRARQRFMAGAPAPARRARKPLVLALAAVCAV